MSVDVLLSHPEQAREYVDSLQRFLPEELADEREAESRVVHSNVSREFYLLDASRPPV